MLIMREQIAFREKARPSCQPLSFQYPPRGSASRSCSSSIKQKIEKQGGITSFFLLPFPPAILRRPKENGLASLLCYVIMHISETPDKGRREKMLRMVREVTAKRRNEHIVEGGDNSIRKKNG